MGSYRFDRESLSSSIHPEGTYWDVIKSLSVSVDATLARRHEGSHGMDDQPPPHPSMERPMRQATWGPPERNIYHKYKSI